MFTERVHSYKSSRTKLSISSISRDTRMRERGIALSRKDQRNKVGLLAKFLQLAELKAKNFPRKKSREEKRK